MLQLGLGLGRDVHAECKVQAWLLNQVILVPGRLNTEHLENEHYENHKNYMQTNPLKCMHAIKSHFNPKLRWHAHDKAVTDHKFTSDI
jgi:hypothetical protein